MRKFLMFTLVIMLIACSGEKAQFQQIDLMGQGVPIMLNITTNSEVEVTNMGDGAVHFITVQDSIINYNFQITGIDAMSTDVAELKKEELTNIKEGKESYFAEVALEEDAGFIYKKQIDDIVSYDFRYIRIQQDRQYTYQTTGVDFLTLEEVQFIYDSIKQ